jgi:hypothetical protein
MVLLYMMYRYRHPNGDKLKAAEAAQQQTVITEKAEEAPKKVETPVAEASTTATTATCD